MVVFKILELLPASVLEMLAAALLMIVLGCIIIAFSAILSEIACRRVIRLLNAIARLTDKEMQEVPHRRHGSRSK